MDEKQLVLNAKNGDKEAFTALYSTYKDRLYRYAFYRLSNPEDAEDAVSECVLSAFWEIKNLKKPEAFPAWLFRILYCACAEQIKHQSKRKEMADINEIDISCDLSRTIEKTELQQALSILKDDEKEIVLLSVVSGFNSKEIGKILDMSAGTIRSKQSRSLKKMREFLG